MAGELALAAKETIVADQRIYIYGHDGTSRVACVRRALAKLPALEQEVFKFDRIGRYTLFNTKIFFEEAESYCIVAACKHHAAIGQMEFGHNPYAPSVMYYMRARFIAGITCDFTPYKCLYAGSKFVGKGRGGCVSFRGKFVIRKPKTKVDTDYEYNNHGKIPDYTPTLLPNECSPGEVIPEVYERFTHYMHQSFSNAPEKIGVHSGHMTCPIDIGDIFTAKDRCEPYITKGHKYRGKPFVTIFPKLQNFTSDGKIRKVYPASSGLQRFLEDEVGNHQADVTPHTIVKGPKFHLHISGKFQSYDIRTADKTLWPYYLRYIREFFSEYEEYFNPLVIQVVKGGINPGALQQFPSGLYGLTAVVGPCFTAAMCDYLGIKHAYIQGDAFVYPAEEKSVEHAYIRRDEDNVVNGFFYDETYHYINGPKKLSSLRALTPGKMNGVRRWEFRRAIYLRLNATNLPPPRNLTIANLFANMSNAELMKLAQEQHERIPGKYLDLSSNNVDQLPHTLACYPCPHEI